MKLYICDVCGKTISVAKGYQFRNIRHLCPECEHKIGHYIQGLICEVEKERNNSK